MTHSAENDAVQFTHPMFTHRNGDVCIWLDGTGWFVPLDAGGEGYPCPHEHPCPHVIPPGMDIDEEKKTK